MSYLQTAWKKLRYFIKRAILGGLVVILPILLIFYLFEWVWKTTTNNIEPLTSWVILQTSMPILLANFLVLATFVALSFFVGTFVETRWGKLIHGGFEELILKKIPFYSMVKKAIGLLLGRKTKAFKSVALIRPSELVDVWLTGFITDYEEETSTYTVFVPTAPNPTSGNIVHIPKSRVYVSKEISVAEGIQTILACGAGSAKIITTLKEELFEN